MKLPERFLFLLLTISLTQCSWSRYKASADREVSGVLEEKTDQVSGLTLGQATLDEERKPDLSSLPGNKKVETFLGDEAGKEKDASVLNLRQCLAIAVKHNREYRTQKESLYLAALSLTLDRHRFAPIFSLGGSGGYARKSNVEIRNGMDKIVRQSSFTATTSGGVSWLTKTGARLAADFTADILHYFSGDLGTPTSSRLLATLTQPLLRGGGYYVTTENLTQAERDLIYQLRDFAQYRQDFTIRIVTSYFDLLQTRDAAKNNYASYTAYLTVAEMSRALAKEGRQTQTELGQIEEALLRAESSWRRSTKSYFQNLDNFKILLGLPVKGSIILDERDLETLEMIRVKMAAKGAMEIALATRLDLQTQKEMLVDAARKISVAKNGLLPGLDFTASFQINSQPSSGLPALDWRRTTYNTGLTLDLPTDQKSLRNNYRATLIAYERSGRDLELKFDQIRLSVIDQMRNMEEAESQYEITKTSVALAERRVEEQRLLMELGRGIARDLVDAQNDLTSALNQRSSLLVTHTIARLQFWREVGLLGVGDQGDWTEPLSRE